MFLIGFFYLLTTFIGFGARAILGQGGVEAAGKGGNLAAPNLAAEPRRRRGHVRRRPVPGDHRRRRVRDDPRGGRRASCSRRRARWRTTSGRTSSARARTPSTRRSASRKIAAFAIGAIAIVDRHHRRRGPERLVHGRPRVRGRGERQLPGAAAGADVAALQHRRRGHRRAVRRDQLDRPRHHQPEGVAGRRLRHRLAVGWYAREPGHHLDPARASSAAAWARCSSSERGRERTFHELYVRSETGLGAEGATGRRSARTAHRQAMRAAAATARRSPASRPPVDSQSRRRERDGRRHERPRTRSSRARGAARPGDVRPARTSSASRR